ncbi:hypothetical protein OSTOST_25252, partial [Ostertagia ostertagi]
MEEVESTPIEDFRFPWEHLADFYAVFQQRNSTDETTLDYDCCLSRVHLNDKDLVKLSERRQIEANGITDSVGAMSLSDNEENDASLTLQSSATEEGTAASESDANRPELKADAWAELPKRFGTTKRQEHSKFYRKRKRTFDDAQRWLNNTTFEEYW